MRSVPEQRAIEGQIMGAMQKMSDVLGNDPEARDWQGFFAALAAFAAAIIPLIAPFFQPKSE